MMFFQLNDYWSVTQLFYDCCVLVMIPRRVGLSVLNVFSATTIEVKDNQKSEMLAAQIPLFLRSPAECLLMGLIWALLSPERTERSPQ